MLQAQLAQSKSLNAALLKSHKNVDSYLFSPQQAAQHDLDSLYALACNGLQFLASSQSSSSSHSRKRTRDHHDDLRSILNNSLLFMPSTKVMRDRTTLSPDENDLINNEVDNVLYAISPWLTEQAAGGVIEWLVRRYRAHEFNVETLLAVFLPYHTTQHFIKLVSILHISPLSPYHALLAPHKKSFTALPLASITAAMSANSLFANKILTILPSHVMHGVEHRAVVGWSLGVGMQYIESMAGKKSNEEALVALLPNLSKTLGTTRDIDTASTCILLFTHLASRVALTSTTTVVILHSLASIKTPVPHTHITMSAGFILLNQDSQDLPESFIRFLIGLTKDKETMTKSSQHLVSPAVLRPVAAALCAFLDEGESEDDVETKDRERAYTLLDHLIRSSQLTPEGAAIIGQALLQGSTASTDSNSFQTKKMNLLRSLYLHHPDQLQLALRNVKESQPDPSEALEQMMMKITMVDTDDFTDEDGAKMGIVLASSAESSLRARGIRILLAKREMETAEVEADTDAIRELLLARLEDSSSEVIHALYSDPIKLVEFIGYPKIISALEATLHADVPVDILSLHAAFLFKAVISEDKRSGRVGTMLFPYLLLTKGGFKRSKAVWASLQESSTTAIGDEMMKGAKELVKHVDWKELKGDVNAMGALNERIVGLLADNIAHSDAYMHILAYILKQAKGSTASSSKTLALLLVYMLLKTLEGPKRLALGITVVEMFIEMGLMLESAEGKETEKVDFHRVVSKPEHQSTYTRIYTAILLLLPTIQNPDGSSETTDWFSQSTTQEAQYVHFTRALYTLLNSSSSSPTVYTQSLRSLFLVIRDSSLLLLSSIWTDRRASASIRLVALRHAHAFIKALMNESDGIERDLQIIFPLLLGGLWEAEEPIRREVAVCVRLIAGAKHDGKAPEIYGLKVLPPGVTEKIKFLDWQDFSSYANALATMSDTLELDSSALTTVQEAVLDITPQSSGKESRYKKRVLSYLLSHACAWHSIDIRLPLLASTSTIPDPGKLQAVTPLIQELASGRGSDMLQRLDPREQEIYANAVLSSLSYAEDIPASSTLSALFDLVQKSYETEEKETALRGAATAMMAMVRLMNPAQRLQLSHLLVSVIKKSTPSAHLKLLASTLDDEQTLVTLLKELRPLPSNEQPTKRARLETAISPLTKLTTVCQALSLSSSRRSTGVLRAMLESLDGTLDTHGTEPTEVTHVQQSIMTALSHMAQFVSNTAESNAQLRIDVLVNLIKGSENPQIIHQTLLLVASLAQWSSDSLLHHLMPILLSTGSYISPRDDLYSARVAEKTIDSVIPLLTSHLRSNYPNKANLQTAARPYLLIFTDACTSMPSHRRTSFFMHLLSILGPADFLNPICLLLLDPDAASIKTQPERMDLAISITQAQNLGVRLAALSELLEDLVAELSLTHGSGSSLLATMRAGSVESEENLSQISKVLDYINQVLDRCRGAVKVEKDEHPQRILGALVRLLAISENKDDSQSLRQRLSGALTSASRIFPPSTVLYTCLQLLRCNDAALQIELYTLLAARLGDVTQEARSQMSDNMVLMIKIIKETLATASTSKLKVASLSALHAVAKSARSTELSALTELVPAATSCIQDSMAAPFAVDALNGLCGSLGPRIIPHLSSVVQMTCSLLRSGSVSDSSISASTSLLRRLLDIASSFWTVADTESVLFVHIKESAHKRGQTQELLKSLGKQTAKKISTHVFIEAFVRVWKTIEQADDFTEEDIAFTVLRHAIKAADRLQIAQESRNLLSVFLEAWDTPKTMEDDSATVKAFVELVVKLNDSSFKPLYRKMFDWAWSTGNEPKMLPDDTRAIAYCQVMNSILSLLKSLMTPYLAPLVGRAVEILDSWSQAPEAFDHFDLWTRLMGLIKRSVEVDDGAFWREEFIRILAPALVRQVPIAADLQRPWMAESLGDTLGVLGALSDTYLKTLNVDLLMHTRSEEARVRISALRSLSRVWLVDGHQLAGWKRETMPFLHECAEDENEDVVHEARGLKAILDKF